MPVAFLFAKMTKKMRNIALKILSLLRKSFFFADDLLVLAGIYVILWSNFRVSQLFGWYSTGITLILFGLFAARLIGRNKRK